MLYSTSYKHCPFCNEDGTGKWEDPDGQPETADEADDTVRFKTRSHPARPARQEQQERPTRGPCPEYRDEDEGEDDDGGEDEDDYAPRAERKGGRRLAGSHERRSSRGGRGGGYRGPSVGHIILLVLSLAIIVAAVVIIINGVRNLPGKKDGAAASPTPSPVTSDAGGGAAESARPTADPNAPAAESFTLNQTTLTFDQQGYVFQLVPAFSPAGSDGVVDWVSSDPNIASVSWNGVVTSVASGSATITATLEGSGTTQTCDVTCSFSTSPGSGTGTTTTTAGGGTSTPSTGGAAGFTLNREDFTLKKGESFRLIVKGTSAAVTWQSSDPNVVTVSEDGTTTGVSKGTCKVTATIDGKSVECTVRCSGQQAGA